MAITLSSEELNQLLVKLYSKRATGSLSVTARDSSDRRVYGTLAVRKGEIVAANYGAYQGDAALAKIAELKTLETSFAQNFLDEFSHLERVNEQPVLEAHANKRMSKSGPAWTQRLQTKVSVLLVVVSTLILGGFALFNALNTRNQLEQDLAVFADTTASRLSKHLELPLWDVDSAAVGDSLEAEMLEQNIAGIVVRDAGTNTIFESRQRDATWEIASTSNVVPSDTVVSKQAISRGNTEIGSVEVFVTKQFLAQAVRETVFQDVLRLLLIDAVLVVITFFAFKRLLIKPILQLTQAADAISRGKVDMNLGVASKDEIGLLADAVERMRTSLKLAISRMQANP